MLARNHLTAEQLGIPQRWLDALLTVRNMMERGEIRHAQDTEVPNGFNMNIWNCDSYCGTIKCLGGWAETVGNFKFPYQAHEHKFDHQLQRLFYPPVPEPYTISVERALRALNGYLTTGEADWRED